MKSSMIANIHDTRKYIAINEDTLVCPNAIETTLLKITT